MPSPRPKLKASAFALHFSKVPDPRKAGMCDHLFLDIVFIAVRVQFDLRGAGRAGAST